MNNLLFCLFLDCLRTSFCTDSIRKGPIIPVSRCTPTRNSVWTFSVLCTHIPYLLRVSPAYQCVYCQASGSQWKPDDSCCTTMTVKLTPVLNWTALYIYLPRARKLIFHTEIILRSKTSPATGQAMGFQPNQGLQIPYATISLTTAPSIKRLLYCDRCFRVFSQARYSLSQLTQISHHALPTRCFRIDYRSVRVCTSSASDQRRLWFFRSPQRESGLKHRFVFRLIHGS